MLLFILLYAKQNKTNGTRRILVECGFVVSRGLWRSNQMRVENLGVVGQQAWCFSLQLATTILLKHKMVTLWRPWGRPWLRPREQRQLGWGGQHSWAPALPSSKWAAPYFYERTRGLDASFFLKKKLSYLDIKGNPGKVIIIIRGPAKLGGCEIRKNWSDSRNRIRGHGIKYPWKWKCCSDTVCFPLHRSVLSAFQNIPNTCSFCCNPYRLS